MNVSLFERHDLGDGHSFFVGHLPESQVFSKERFEELWAMHPTEYHCIMMHGRPVLTPRFQQAYGKDYHYTGRVNTALPMPEILRPLHDWLRENVDERLNGLLLNWYDGALRHYIGRHRDSTAHMVVGAPIVTVSLGAEQTFRLRPWKREGQEDFPAPNATVFVEPFETNLCWTHEVPHFARNVGRRISVTGRAFKD